MPFPPAVVLPVSATPWLVLVLLVAGLLAVDLLMMGRRVLGARQAAIASVVWVAISLGFFAGLRLLGEAGQADAFLAGYLVEKALSLDNVFVFLLVFSAFGIPAAERHRLLTYGIVGALVLRIVFIVAGAAALEAFSWVSFLFAADFTITPEAAAAQIQKAVEAYKSARK